MHQYNSLGKNIQLEWLLLNYILAHYSVYPSCSLLKWDGLQTTNHYDQSDHI